MRKYQKFQKFKCFSKTPDQGLNCKNIVKYEIYENIHKLLPIWKKWNFGKDFQEIHEPLNLRPGQKFQETR